MTGDRRRSRRSVVRAARPLTGHGRRCPGDKSISHRALLLAALAEGTSTITGLSDGDDVAGPGWPSRPSGPGSSDRGDGVVTVTGGRSRLPRPTAPLDLGNSGTGMRLLAGVVAGAARDHPADRRRLARGPGPMDRVAEPLGLMGATVIGAGERCLPPLRGDRRCRCTASTTRRRWPAPR